MHAYPAHADNAHTHKFLSHQPASSKLPILF